MIFFLCFASLLACKEINFLKDESTTYVEFNDLPQYLNSEKPAHQLKVKEISINQKQVHVAGRYVAKNTCSDHSSVCLEKEPQLILNLLEDGQAYQTIVLQGCLFSNYRRKYADLIEQQNAWVLSNQSEIAIYHANGAVFYYRIKDQNQLVLDLNKTLNNAKNQILFKQGYTKPKQEYIFEKKEEVV